MLWTRQSKFLQANNPLRTRLSLFHTTASALNGQNLQLGITPDEANRVGQNEEIVKYQTAGLFFVNRKLPPQFRKGINPIYIGPYSKQISLAKRVSMGFGVIGIYVSKIMYDIDIFIPEISYFTLIVTSLPYPIIQYLTSAYVVSITRIYDKTQPQTLENLVKDESFIISRLNFTGRGTVDHLVKLDSIRLAAKKLGWINWESADPDNKIMRSYYVEDNTGGMRMDRIWGIIEKASGVDKGRSFFET